MGKLVLLEHISLDGFAAGPNKEIDWIKYDKELEDYVTELRSNTDATLYGRVTFQIMEEYWPKILKNPGSPANQMKYARWVTEKLKIVVSKTLSAVEWNNTMLIKDNIFEAITDLKEKLQGDILLIGSPTLVKSFMKLGLIDEYRIDINPILLGSGIKLFDGNNKVNLRLLESTQFNSGVVAFHYVLNN